MMRIAFNWRKNRQLILAVAGFFSVLYMIDFSLADPTLAGAASSFSIVALLMLRPVALKSLNTPSRIAIVAFILWLIFSVVGSTEISDSFLLFLLAFLAFLGLMPVSKNIVTGRSAAFIFSLILFSILVFAAYSGAPLEQQPFPAGNPNLNAYLIAFLIPLLFLDWHSTNSPERILRLVIVASGVAMIVLSGGRGAILALLFSLSIVFWRRLDVRVAISALVFTAIYLIIILGLYTDPTLEVRSDLWLKTTRVISDNWLFGVGTGRWKIALFEYGLGDTQGSSGLLVFRRVHNDFLQVAAESGLLGLLSWLIVWACGMHAVRHNRILTACGCVLIVASTISFPMERPVFVLLWVWWLGWSLGATSRVSHSNYFRIGYKLVLIGLCLLMTLRWLGWREVYDAEEALSDNKWEQAIEEILLAKSYGITTDEFGSPLSWKQGLALRQLGQNPADIWEATRIRYPFHPLLMSDLGAWYIANDRLSEGCRLVRSAVDITPDLVNARLNSAMCYCRTGNVDSANLMLDGLNEMDARYGEYIKALRDCQP